MAQNPIDPISAASGKTVTKNTEIEITNGIVKSVQRINIAETFRKMPRTVKIAGAVYIAGIAAVQLFGTYEAGKIKLIEYREAPHKTFYTSELDAVTKGCKEGSIRRFMNALIWPTNIVEYIAPPLIIWLNPVPKEKQNQKENNE